MLARKILSKPLALILATVLILGVVPSIPVSASTASQQVTITAMAGPGGYVSSGGTTASSRIFTLTATANSGYVFEGWYYVAVHGNIIDENTNRLVSISATMPVDVQIENDSVSVASGTNTAYHAFSHGFTGMSFEARFKQASPQNQPVTITTTASPSNGGTVSGGGTFSSNTNTTIRATPSSNDWVLDGWYYKGSWFSSNSTVNVEISFTNSGGQSDIGVLFGDIGFTGLASEGANLPFEARFKQVGSTKHTITFNANGGNVSPASAQTGTNGRLTSLPIPTRNGFDFTGWFPTATEGIPITTSTVFTSDTQIFAQWTAVPTNVHTITFNANGGSVSPASAQTGSNGRLASLPNPMRSGFTSNGWFTAATGGTQISPSTVFSANTIIYAQWTADPTKIHTITFRTIDPITTFFTQTSAKTDAAGKLTSLPTPTRNGFVFNGWFTAATGGTQITTSTIFTSNTEIYTQWAAEPLQITTQTLPDARVGRPYNSTLQSTGTIAVNWEITSGSLPEGLVLNTYTGQITGNLPDTVASSFASSFTVRATSVVGGTATKTLKINGYNPLVDADEIIRTENDLRTKLIGAGKTYVLANDIPLTKAWTPVDDFRGILDGNGFIIKNLYVTGNRANAGLFGKISQGNVTIRHLGIDIGSSGINAGGTIDTYSYAGGLIGLISGSPNVTIENCYISGGTIEAYKQKLTIAAYTAAGGMIGVAEGNGYTIKIINSFTKCTLNAESRISLHTTAAMTAYCGGLIGERKGGRSVEIVNSYSAGSMEAKTTDFLNLLKVLQVGGAALAILDESTGFLLGGGVMLDAILMLINNGSVTYDQDKLIGFDSNKEATSYCENSFHLTAP